MKRAICAAGFTLLEVMVAMAILAIALTTLIGSQNQSLFIAYQADFEFQSTILARQKLAEILADPDGVLDATGDFGDDQPDYSWKLEVHDAEFADLEVLDGAEAYLKRLDLSVQTADESRSFTLSRYIQVEGDL